MTMKPTTITTVILDVERMPSSSIGHPRYRLATPVGTFPTRPNTNDAYALTAGQEARQATLTLDGRGHVYGIELDR